MFLATVISTSSWSTQASAGKTLGLPHAAIATGGMAYADLAITVHSEFGHNAMPGDPAIAMKPRLFGRHACPTLVVKQRFNVGFEALRGSVRMWESRVDLQYCITGLEMGLNENIAMTTEMLRVNAVPGMEGVLTIADDDHRLLADDDHRLLTMSAFKLTDLATQRLEYGELLQLPVPMFAVRPGGIALEDRTMLECVLMVEEAGFSWRALPASINARLALTYTAGGDKLWYSTGVQVSHR